MSRCVRSLFDAEWMIRAFDDGALLCTAAGRRVGKVLLQAPATCLLIVLGPQRRPWRLVIGRSDGVVEVRTVPNLSPLVEWKVSDSPVTALASLPCRHSDTPRLVCGDSQGAVREVADPSPGIGVQPLFTLSGSVSALRVRRDRIDAWSGWHREKRRWSGEPIGEARGRGLMQAALPV